MKLPKHFYQTKKQLTKDYSAQKKNYRSEKVTMEMPPEDQLANRLDNVLRVIYLLFNEGYYSRTQNSILRKDFCLEALRLALLLTEYEQTNLPKTNALIALMCFHTSRFESRQSNENQMILYEDQDKELWDQN